jgi:hypothetical protein
MPLILLSFSRMAVSLRAIAAIEKTVIAAMTTPIAESALEVATKRNSRVFAAYIVVLVLTALLIAFFTWWTWDSGNRVQEAIQKEASARIEEAKSTAAQANERSKFLENSNLILRSDLNTQTGEVAGLQKSAADALMAQQRVEVELSKQRERTATIEIAAADARTKQAEAEERLAQLQKQIGARGVPVAKILEILRSGPPGKAIMQYQEGSPETKLFAQNLSGWIGRAGWDIPQPTGIPLLPDRLKVSLSNIFIVNRDGIIRTNSENLMWKAFIEAGFSIGVIQDEELPEDDVVHILVGPKF